MTAPMSAALQAHYAQGTTTITTLLLVILRDGTTYGFTAHQEPITYSGHTYLSVPAYSATAVASSLDLSVDNMEVQAIYNALGITADDLKTGRWDYAYFQLLEVNFRDLSMGHRVVRTGRLGEVRGARSKADVELRGLMQRFSRRIVILTPKECPYDLGDSRCKVNLGPYTVTGGITGGITVNRQFTDTARTEATDRFTGGLLTFTSGLNAGLAMEVRRSTSVGVIELQQQMPFAMQVGDTYTVYRGCQKRFDEDCVTVFANGVNFGGFPHLPGHDVYKGPT